MVMSHVPITSVIGDQLELNKQLSLSLVGLIFSNYLLFILETHLFTVASPIHMYMYQLTPEPYDMYQDNENDE